MKQTSTRAVRMGGEIAFWFEFGSNYSYLSVMRIEDAAAKHGVKVIWKPFLLGPIFKSFGWDTSPFVLQKEKGEYMWNDMVRQCRKYDLPWTRPATFPRSRAGRAKQASIAGADRNGQGQRNLRGADVLRPRRDVLGQRPTRRCARVCSRASSCMMARDLQEHVLESSLVADPATSSPRSRSARGTP